MLAERSRSEDKQGVWADAVVPVGNAPPLSMWPLVVSAIVWVAWIIFLVTMAVSVLRSSSA